jgi:ABC-2 type transport system permease protein
MEKILVIAQREFMMAVGRKAYVLSILVFPIMILSLGVAQSINAEQAGARRSQAIGVIDPGGVIDFSITEKARTGGEPSVIGASAETPPFRIARYGDMDQALKDLQSGELAVFYVVPTDYRATGKVEAYARDELNPKETHDSHLAALQNLLRASVLGPQVAAETVSLVISPINVTEMAVSDKGAIAPARSQYEKLIVWMAPLGLSMVLGMWIMISSRYMLSAAMEEEANRVMEVMLSSVSPAQLLCGKLVGLSGVAFLHLTVFLAIVGLARSTFWSFLILPLSTLAICLVFCVAAYLFYAGLLVTAGMAGWGRSASFMALTVWIPMIMVDAISSDPNGALARALSFIPWTATLTMVLRLSLATVPTPDVLISLAVLIASAYLAVRGGARVFHVSTLMTGKRASVAEVTRWLRTASST